MPENFERGGGDAYSYIKLETTVSDRLNIFQNRFMGVHIFKVKSALPAFAKPLAKSRYGDAKAAHIANPGSLSLLKYASPMGLP